MSLIDFLDQIVKEAELDELESSKKEPEELPRFSTDAEAEFVDDTKEENEKPTDSDSISVIASSLFSRTLIVDSDKGAEKPVSRLKRGYIVVSINSDGKPRKQMFRVSEGVEARVSVRIFRA